MDPHQFIRQKLDQRQQLGLLRTLKPETELIDLCSNDYLGFARSPELRDLLDEEIANHPSTMNGAAGSRLLSGNTRYTEDLEHWIARYHDADAGLLFNSGYDANLGLLSSLPQRGDTVIHDSLAHASIIDGIRLSHATRQSFTHNNLTDLEKKLQRANGQVYVVVESVYSMDGDLAPLIELIQLARTYNAALIVDEAHALGVFGKGLVNQLQLQDQVFARVITFGKALGCHGAIVLGSSDLRNYLINFARSFIYTTAAPFHQVATIKMAYQMLDSDNGITRMNRLHKLINVYNDLMQDRVTEPNTSAIKTIIIGGNEQTTQIAQQLQASGFDIRPILSPTVPQGTERLRICLHEYNTDQQLQMLVTTLRTLLHEQ